MVAARFESCVQADEFLSPSRLGMKGKSAQANGRLNMKRKLPVLKQRKDFQTLKKLMPEGLKGFRLESRVTNQVSGYP